MQKQNLSNTSIMLASPNILEFYTYNLLPPEADPLAKFYLRLIKC